MSCIENFNEKIDEKAVQNKFKRGNTLRKNILGVKKHTRIQHSKANKDTINLYSRIFDFL
jgi:hypothetical protein